MSSNVSRIFSLHDILNAAYGLEVKKEQKFRVILKSPDQIFSKMRKIVVTFTLLSRVDFKITLLVNLIDDFWYMPSLLSMVYKDNERLAMGELNEMSIRFWQKTKY